MRQRSKILLVSLWGWLQRTGGDERGFALILALSMLAILSILGAIVLSNSGTDISVATNFQGTQKALYAADRVVEYGISKELRDKLIDMGSGSSLNLASEPYKTNINLEGCSAAAGCGEMESGSTTYLESSTAVPAKFDKPSSEGTIYEFYHVSGTAVGPNQSHVRVEATIFKTRPPMSSGILGSSGEG